jgi:tetratricopeptide (TPR) repeat protein
MPSRNDLDLFNKTLIGLGNEPSVTARWGEEVEAVPPGQPEEDAGFADVDAGPEEDASPEAPEPEQPEVDMGFEDLGGDFEAPEPEAGAESDFEAPEDVDEFDLGAFAEGGFEAEEEPEAKPGAESPGGFEMPETDFEIPESESAPDTGFEMPEGADEFDLGAFAEGGFEAEEGFETEGEEAPDMPAEEPEEGVESAGGFDMPETDFEIPESESPPDTGFEMPEDVDEFDLGAFAEGGFEAEEEPETEPEAEDFGADFEIPEPEEGDLEAPEDEFGAFEEVAGEPTEELAEEPTEELWEAAPEEGLEEPSEEIVADFEGAETETETDLGAPEADFGGLPDFDQVEDLGDLDDFGDIGDLGDVGEEVAEETSSIAPDMGFEDEGFEISDEEGGPEAPAGPEGVAAAGDDFSFGSDFEMGDEEELGEDVSADIGDIDEFSLGDFGAEFGVADEEDLAEEAGGDEDLNPALDVSGAPPVPLDAGQPGVALTDEEFEAVKQTLGALPLNVKMAVEQVFAEEKADPEESQALLRQLVREESPRAIATTAGRILGKTIRVPRSYEKRTGDAFERQRQTLGYQIRTTVLPVIRVILVVAAVVGALSYAGYRFVYQPLRARGLYEQGLAAIDAEQYDVGNQRFDAAVELRPVKDRYLQYAERFVAERQFDLATQKYEQLLRQFGFDKEGVLTYADYRSRILGDYPGADELLRLFLYGRDRGPAPAIDGEPFDYDARLLRGDNFMRWDANLPPERRLEPVDTGPNTPNAPPIEGARNQYAQLVEEFGQTDPLLTRMLRYFVRVENAIQADRIKEAILADPDFEVDPETLADLAGFLVDRRELGDVVPILRRAQELEEEWIEGGGQTAFPGIYYELARYYRILEEPASEDQALAAARGILENQPRTDRRQTAMYVDTLIRIGENHYEDQEFLDAEIAYEDAQEAYEDARALQILRPEPVYGRLYARRGDVAYYVSREFDRAGEFYALAEANGYENESLDYKQGHILYRRESYTEALEQFFDAAGRYTDNENLLYATANALYYQRSYYAAQGYYVDLINQLESRRSRIRTLLVDEDPEHRSLIEAMIRSYNNLGVTLIRIGERESAEEKTAEGLSYLTASSELTVNYRRNPETGARPESVNLAYLNQRQHLYPRQGFDFQIYNTLPADLESFWD